MFKVRRGDAPATLAETGMPVILRGGKLATPLHEDGLGKGDIGTRARRELGKGDGCEDQKRYEFDRNRGTEHQESDEDRGYPHKR